MFEQSRYAEGGQATPSNTAMQGTRYKGSFIPPKPAQPEFFEERVGQNKTMITSPAMPASQSQNRPADVPAPSLQLNPPKQPVREHKRTPSLFERITGTVQHTLESAMGRDEAPQQRRNSPAFHASETQTKPLTGNSSPAQGSLNIDSPSGPAKNNSGEDELDIPAFLRRQAN